VGSAKSSTCRRKPRASRYVAVCVFCYGDRARARKSRPLWLTRDEQRVASEDGTYFSVNERNGLVSTVSGTSTGYNPAQGGTTRTEASAYWQSIHRCNRRRLDRFRCRPDSSGCILAISTSSSLASSAGRVIACAGHSGRQCGTLRVVALAVRRVSTRSPRQGTHSCRSLGTGCPSESDSGDGVSIICRCDSTC